MGVIYRAINKINNKSYIGLTTLTLSTRKDAHICTALDKIETRRKYRSIFHRAIKKYGRENFVWEILYESDSIDKLKEMETYYIFKYRSYTGYKDCMGYNMTLGGEHNSMDNPEVRNKCALLTKIALANPEVKKRQCENTKEALAKPEIKRKHIAGIRKSWTNGRRKHYKKLVDGENNPNAKYTWTIYLDGHLFDTVKCLKTWCKQMNMKYISIYMGFRENRCYKGYKIKRHRRNNTN